MRCRVAGCNVCFHSWGENVRNSCHWIKWLNTQENTPQTESRLLGIHSSSHLWNHPGDFNTDSRDITKLTAPTLSNSLLIFQGMLPCCRGNKRQIPKNWKSSSTTIPRALHKAWQQAEYMVLHNTTGFKVEYFCTAAYCTAEITIPPFVFISQI